MEHPKELPEFEISDVDEHERIAQEKEEEESTSQNQPGSPKKYIYCGRRHMECTVSMTFLEICPGLHAAAKNCKICEKLENSSSQ